MKAEPSEPTTKKKPRVAMLIATGFGLGYLPKAPGTWGSLGGVALYEVGMKIIAVGLYWGFLSIGVEKPGTVAKGFWGIDFEFGALLMLASLWMTLVGVAGVWAADRTANYLAKKDPQSVVVDEISGQMLCFMPMVPRVLSETGGWKYLVVGLILFRVFDIWKPWPARAAEKLPGGWGIMADDWVAGVYAAAGLWAARALGL